jgi:anti-anti-sigma factor
MLIEVTEKDDICVVRFEGRFVSGWDPDYLRAKEEIAGRRCEKVLADFREVSQIGSTGIGFIVAIYVSVHRNSKGRFVVVGLQRRVREVFDITRVSTVIPLADDLASGLAALRSDSSAAAG